MPGFAQFSTCDSNLVNAHLNPAGYRRLYVATQPCSMYYYSTTPKTGINAHRDAANLNVPQLIIDNTQENSDVSGALFVQGVYAIAGSGNAVWLGITDSSTLFSWRVMATGQPATFFNWTAGDPNNLRPGCYNGTFGCSLCTGTNAYWCAYGEDCAIMQPSGQWIDNSCDGTLTGNPTGSPINRTVVLELNTCPVITKPHDTLICSGNPVNLSAPVITGGTAPYTYAWSPGSQTGPTISVSPTTTTTYSVEASDHYLCKADTTVTVSVVTPVIPTINASANPVCKNTNDNISLSSVSGTATYTWNFDAGSSIISGSGSGPYTVQWSTGGTKTISVTVSDNGCVSNATRTVTVDSANAAFTLNPTTTCTGQSVTATVAQVSGTANYTWSFGGGTVVSGTGAGPYTITWPTIGVKTVGLTVTDNGCTANSSVTENITTGPSPTVTLNPSATACPGQPVAVTLTGAGSGTATYTWDFHGGTVISGSGAGPYSISWNTSGPKDVDLTVTDGGCSGTAPTQTIDILNGIVSNAGGDISICPGVAGQLGAAPTTGYSYSWSPAGGLSNPGIANPTVTIPTNTTGINIDTVYILTTTQGSCSGKDTVKVTIYPTPNSAFTINPTTTCQGTNVTVTYGGTVSGTATYNWNFNGGNVVSGSGAGPYTVNWSSTGSQTVDLTVTDNGCPSNTSHSVTVSNSLGVAFTLNPSTTACAGQPVAVTLTGSASGTATYTWNFNGGNVISGAGAGPYSVSWNTNGMQNVDLTVTDGGCTGSATQSITIANTASADAGTPVQLCPGVQGNLGSPPVAGYTYSWSPTWGLSNASASDPTITIPSNPTGTIIDTFYVVTATSGSCSAMDTVPVRIYPDIDNSFVVSSLNACAGDNITVTYGSTVSATATYNWNFGGANVVSGSGAGPYTINWGTQGNKTISLDITDNGCTGTTSSTVIAVGSRPTAIAGNDSTICSGNSIQLGSPTVAGVTYAWTPAAHLSSASVSDPTFTETNTSVTNDVTNYMLIATGGCADTAYVIITVTPVTPMSIVLSGPATFCQGDSVILSDNLAPQADYLWSTTETSAAITVKTSGTYTLTAHDAAGCTYISDPSVTITVNPDPTLSLAPGGEVDESCPGANDGSLTVQATNGTPTYTYTWSTTPSQGGTTATGLSPGSYDVSVTDNNGCTSMATYPVNPAPSMSINIDSIKNLSCNNQADGAIYTSVTGGNPPVSYLWSTGEVTPSITHLSADTFSVTATDTRGCTADTSIIIAQPVPITFAAVSPLSISYGGSEQIEINILPAANYIYSWSPAGTLSCANCPNPVASPLLTTIYTLTVTDPVGGCSGIDTITLFVDPSKHFYVPNAFTPNGDGVNDIYMVFASGPVKYFEIEVFDRWGEKVYQSNDMDTGWDGKYRGVFASNGTYVYQVTITFLDGQTLSNKGSLTLLK